MTMTPDTDRLDECLAGPGATRVLAVLAHPDDEVLGCGALLGRCAAARIIHVTDGAPRNGADAQRHGFASAGAYASARAAEARAALALAGLPAERLSSLGLPDQDASSHLALVTRRLVAALEHADIVLTHAFEGGHSDHDAVAFAVQEALQRLEASRRPLRVEMPFYYAGPEGWCRQTFLPQRGAGLERLLVLDGPAQALKVRMIEAHASQGDTLRSFDATAERFRVAPHYDFTVRPHGGDLLYERHGWNLDWPSWVARVRAAQAELALEPAA